MTPHSQQEYIITKKELDDIQDAIGLSADCEISHTICQEAIDRARNRPTPAPAAPEAPHTRVQFTNTIAKPNYVISEKLTKEIEGILNDKCDESTAYRIPTVIRSRKLIEHDATIRNQTLDKIIPTLGRAIQTDISDNDYVMIEDLESVIESLRTPSTQAQQHERGDQR